MRHWPTEETEIDKLKAENRRLHAEACQVPGTMNSKPHTLDLQMARDYVQTEMAEIEKRLAKAGHYSDLSKEVSPENQHAKGEHRAYFTINLKLLSLLANWRNNVPASRKAEIAVNNEAPEGDS